MLKLEKNLEVYKSPLNYHIRASSQAKDMKMPIGDIIVNTPSECDLQNTDEEHSLESMSDDKYAIDCF